jgi:fructokinase
MLIFAHRKQKMGKKIVAFGEVVWDILPGGKVLGGTPVNMVFRCNSFGEKGFLLSRLGYDNSGKEALDKLEELGISVKNVQIDDEFPTATVHVTFDENNESKYKVELDVAFDHIEFSAQALKLARKADCLFYGLLPQRFGVSKNTIRELIKESPDSIHFFDLKLFDHFFNKKVVEDLLKSSDIVRIKEKEVSFIINELGLKQGDLEEFGMQLSKKYKLNLILITRGTNGVLAYQKSKGMFVDSGYNIEVVDNIGSGMAFCAGFLHYYLYKNSIQRALDFGNAAGALNTTKRGATTYFDITEVLDFMKNTPKKKLV